MEVHHFSFYFRKTGNVCINITLRCIHVITVAVKKQLSIIYSECVSVALVIQHAKHMCYIVICGLPGFTVFFHISS